MFQTATSSLPTKKAPKLSLIALVGVPNCGKTAIFNGLTGSRQKVANYSGVTVEKKEGVFLTPQKKKLHLIDLPGTYSLRARTPDEAITRDVVLGRLENEKNLDAFICVVDACRLHFGLSLVLELKKIKKPFVVAVNMMDLAFQQGSVLDLHALSHELGVPVVPTVAIRKKGFQELIDCVESEFLKHFFLKLQVPQSDLEEKEVIWQEPSAAQLRSSYKEVEHILNIANKKPPKNSRLTEYLDRIFLHPVFGLLSLFLILFLIFQAVFLLPTFAQDFIERGILFLQTDVATLFPPGALRSLLFDGVVAGVGSVLVFVPQILTLFFFILLLEDFGYMVRAAFLMDKLMGKVGLHGKAFIPLLSSFACAIPGILSARTIESSRERLLTILISPLIPCSARLPVYTLIIAAFIPQHKILNVLSLQGLVLLSVFLVGIISAFCIALGVKKFAAFKKQITFPLLLELPTYKIPSLTNLFLGLLEKAKVFLWRAGTIILALMVLIWFLSSYPTPSLGASGTQASSSLPIESSFAGMMGKFLEPLFLPIGFHWQIVIALIPGMAAREVAVATLGTIYAISGASASEERTQALGAVLSSAWTFPTALAFLTWYIFAPQCLSTLVVTRRETNSLLWPLVMFVYMFVLAYGAAFLVFQCAKFFGSL